MGMTFTDQRPTDIYQRGIQRGDVVRSTTKDFRTVQTLVASENTNFWPSGADSFRILDILYTSLGILLPLSDRQEVPPQIASTQFAKPRNSASRIAIKTILPPKTTTTGSPKILKFTFESETAVNGDTKTHQPTQMLQQKRSTQMQ
jgi:hypothetical protein